MIFFSRIFLIRLSKCNVLKCLGCTKSPSARHGLYIQRISKKACETGSRSKNFIPSSSHDGTNEKIVTQFMSSFSSSFVE